MSSKEYWDGFYLGDHTVNASPFAKFIVMHLEGSLSILDLGCGNGRDADYFARDGHYVIGVDQCAVPCDPGGAHRVQDDLLSYLKNCPMSFDVVYMRFVLHAVPPEYGQVLLRAAIQVLSLGGMLATEQRAFGGEHPDDHPRWPIHSGNLLTEVLMRDLRVIRFEESTGLATWYGEDPLVSRLIARRAK